MELNDYLFGALLMLILLETMIIIGIYGGKRETGVTKKNQGYITAAILLALLGFLLAFLKPINDPYYGVGIALLAVALTVIIFVRQENDSEKILNKLDELTKDLKSPKSIVLPQKIITVSDERKTGKKDVAMVLWGLIMGVWAGVFGGLFTGSLFDLLNHNPAKPTPIAQILLFIASIVMLAALTLYIVKLIEELMPSTPS
ncbi:MAG: hypothetical protein PHF57_08475 [Methanoregula sp.]|jgi:thiamine transporter ThiT|nr:hypothetical protein [Methanoregula sp.]MDD5188229.1 hypothetical protein [Methanoregula sp.]